jgi:hypothetical protein
VTPSMNITGATAAAVTMTITSTAPTTSSAPASLSANQRPWIAVNGGIFAVGVLLIGALPRRRRRRRFAGLLLVWAVLASFAGCGGSGSGGGGGPHQIPGTTVGAYSFTVNGAFSAGGVSQSETPSNITIQ